MIKRVWSLGLVTVGALAVGEETAVPALTVETLAVPVVSSRTLEGDFAPNPRGGWSYVGQFMNYRPTTELKKETLALPSGEHYLAYANTNERPDAEWVVTDLSNGQTRIFSWPGFHAPNVGAALAGNGRLFFSVDYAHVYYYEPSEDAVKPLGRVCDDLNQLRCFYKFMTGPDGMIYGAAQATTGLTQLFRLNPDTLEYKLYPEIGLKGRRTGLTYGYYLALDPPWMYVAVGQGNWELFAVNADTGEKRCLAEVQGEGTRITVSRGADYCTGAISSPGQPREFWLVDGVALPAKSTNAPSLRGKTYKMVEWKKTKPMDLSGRPQLDASRPIAIGGKGDGELIWRPGGSTGEWSRIPIAIRNAEPAKIESLTLLPDGTLLGNGEQYNGFFRYTVETKKVDFYGKFGPSRPVTVLHEGLLYWCGYPNTTLYAFDWTKPWTATVASQGKGSNDNPRQLGTLGQGKAEAHHSHRIQAGMGRVYVIGRRERWSTGTGLGYYDAATKKLFGLGQEHKTVHPEALMVLPDLERVVFSGRPNEGDARLWVYDRDLKEVERIEIRPGLASGGDLFASDSGSQFFGCVSGPESNRVTFYRYDLKEKKILKQMDVAAEVDNVFTRASDKTWWALADRVLYKLDPASLALEPAGSVTGGVRNPVWIGKDLYGSRGGELIRVQVP